MKKMILTVATILTVGLVNAQEFQENFLEKDFALYQNTFFKLKTGEVDLKNAFYESVESSKKMYGDNVIYPTILNSGESIKDSLINRVFKVEKILDNKGFIYDPTDIQATIFEPFFELRDTLTNKVIYFKYRANYKGYFPFVTSEIKYDESLLKSEIKREKDDFTGEINIRSPYTIPVDLTKVINKGKVVYYLSLDAYGSTPNVNKRGVTILFSDGTKWIKNELIDVRVSDYGYKYSAFIALTPIEVDMFIKKEISKFRLYIYDNDLEKSEAKKFKTFVKIIKSMK